MFEKEFLIFTLIFLIVYFFCKNYRQIYLASKIPNSDFDWSLSGILKFIRANNVEVFKYLIVGQEGPMTKTWLGPALFVNICSPEDAKIIFNAKECMRKPSILEKCSDLCLGTVFGPLSVWRAHRRVLNPYFNFQSIRNLIPIFNDKTNILLENLKRMEEKGNFDVFKFLAAMTLESFLKVMNYDIDVQNQEEEKRDSYTENLKAWSSNALVRVYRPWLYPDFIYRLTSSYKESALGKLNSGAFFSSQVIKSTRESSSDNNNDDEDKKSNNFIHALLRPENNFTEAELYDEVDTLILAAQDTSPFVASSTLLLLAMHHDVQEKVHDELMRVIGQPSENLSIDFDQINQLEYLEMAINESMRLIPVVPFAFRYCTSEIKSHEGYTIPANSNLYIPIYNIHRNKKFWGDDAEEFKPERFSKENFSKIHPYAFMPFTKGPRMCLGWRYAIILIKIQLANILLNYKVDTKLKLNELEYHLAITLNIVQGHSITIEKRQYD